MHSRIISKLCLEKLSFWKLNICDCALLQYVFNLDPGQTSCLEWQKLMGILDKITNDKLLMNRDISQPIIDDNHLLFSVEKSPKDTMTQYSTWYLLQAFITDPFQTAGIG